MKKLIVALTSLAVLSACTVKPVGNTKLRDLSNSAIEQKIIPNVTTKQEVREMFGEPNKTNLAQYDLSEMWFYEYYNDNLNYTPTVMFPITLPLSILFGHNFLGPISKKENHKQLRVKIENNTVTKVSTAIDSQKWY